MYIAPDDISFFIAHNAKNLAGQLNSDLKANLNEHPYVIYRTGKFRFSGAQNRVLLKASSGKCCAPHNFVLLVTSQLYKVFTSSCTSSCPK